MYNIEIVIIISLIFIALCQISYYIGFTKGFKRSKDIDDKIIEDLSKKYNIEK